MGGRKKSHKVPGNGKGASGDKCRCERSQSQKEGRGGCLIPRLAVIPRFTANCRSGSTSIQAVCPRPRRSPSARERRRDGASILMDNGSWSRFFPSRSQSFPSRARALDLGSACNEVHKYRCGNADCPFFGSPPLANTSSNLITLPTRLYVH